MGAFNPELSQISICIILLALVCSIERHIISNHLSTQSKQSSYLINPFQFSRIRLRNRIQPKRQPIPALRNLHLNIRHRTRIIIPIQLLIRLIRLQHIFAIQRIRILRPLNSTILRRTDIHTTNPPILLPRITPTINSLNQLPRKPLHHTRRIFPTRILLHHLRVPTRVQVRSFSIPRDGDVVAADFLGFVVQGLGNVAHEMDDEFRGFFSVFGAEAAVLDAGGVV